MTEKKRKGRKPTTPPCPAHPDWSTAMYWSWIRSALRRAWLRWPPRYKALAASKKRDTVSRRLHYECSSCGELYPHKYVEVDHIKPVGSLKCHDDLPAFVERLLSPIENLCVVCKSCHKKKTAAQRGSSDDDGLI